MKILMLAPQTPYPPGQGAALRNYHLLRALADRFDVGLFAFDPHPSPGARAHLASFCREVVLVPFPGRRSVLRRAKDAIASPLPDMGLRLASAAADEAIGGLIDRWQPDVLQVEAIEMARFALPYRQQRRARLVFDEHNAEYALQRSAFLTDVRQPRRLSGAAYSLLQWLKLQRYERATIRHSQAVVCVSALDRDLLIRLAPEVRPIVIPNAVAVANYRYRSPAARAPSLELLFTGTMDYRPNVDAMVWFGTAILPRLREALPGVRLTIVGRNPVATVRALAGPAVEVTGAVPDVRPFLERAAVYVAPLRMGSGTRFKVLEAMASGIPVVSTSFGAEGLDVRSGSQVLTADEPGAFAAAVNRLLTDRSLATALSADAAEYVRRRFDWSVVTPPLIDLYRGLTTERLLS